MAGSVTGKYLHGTGGDVWLDGEKITNLKSIESKITIQLEEVKTCGNSGSEYVNTGWTGEGTLTLEKLNSKGINLLAAATKNGETPQFKIITSLKNKSTGATERTALYIIFTEFSLAKFEAKGTVEEELPFKILDYEVLETIA